MKVSLDDPVFGNLMDSADEASFKLLSAILDWNESLDNLMGTASVFHDSGLQRDLNLLRTRHNDLVIFGEPIISKLVC